MEEYNFDEQKVFVRLGEYKNKRPAIYLVNTISGEPFLKASINVPEDTKYINGEVVIKNYSENVGMLEFLLKNKLVTKPHRWLESAYVFCPVVFLTDVLVKQENEILQNANKPIS
jgi:hypothetical protein